MIFLQNTHTSKIPLPNHSSEYIKPGEILPCHESILNNYLISRRIEKGKLRIIDRSKPRLVEAIKEEIQEVEQEVKQEVEQEVKQEVVQEVILSSDTSEVLPELTEAISTDENLSASSNNEIETETENGNEEVEKERIVKPRKQRKKNKEEVES